MRKYPDLSHLSKVPFHSAESPTSRQPFYKYGGGNITGPTFPIRLAGALITPQQ